MASVRFSDLQSRPTAFLDCTSLTLDEFQPLVPPCEAAPFQAHMAAWRLDHQRSGGMGVRSPATHSRRSRSLGLNIAKLSYAATCRVPAGVCHDRATSPGASVGAGTVSMSLCRPGRGGMINHPQSR